MHKTNKDYNGTFMIKKTPQVLHSYLPFIIISFVFPSYQCKWLYISHILQFYNFYNKFYILLYIHNFHLYTHSHFWLIKFVWIFSCLAVWFLWIRNGISNTKIFQKYVSTYHDCGLNLVLFWDQDFYLISNEIKEHSFLYLCLQYRQIRKLSIYTMVYKFL